MVTGKGITFVTTKIALFPVTHSDIALLTVHDGIIRQAPTTMNVCYCKTISIGKLALAMDLALEDVEQSLLKFLIIVAVGNVDGADGAMEAARRKEVRIDCYHSTLQLLQAPTAGRQSLTCTRKPTYCRAWRVLPMYSWASRLPREAAALKSSMAEASSPDKRYTLPRP